MHSSETDDALLVAATRRGDHAAFARIIERYQRPVYAVAFSGVRDRALADDLTQDTFVLAWKRLGELRDPTRLPAWLCGIARNLARDARKRRRFETRSGPTDAAHAIDSAATPFEALDDAQCDLLVAAALAGIPDTYREPLVLYYFEDRSVDDVARALGISAETTHRRLSRGRKFLAERTHELRLVETRVAQRGPRAGTAAAVLAIVGGLAAGSHVEASPAKGLVMPKLVIAAVLVATLGAAGILAADSSRTPARKPVAAGAVPVTHTAPVAATPVVAPATSAKPAAAASRPATATTTASATAATFAPAAPALPPATTIAVPDCAAVARHMTALTMATLAKKPFPAEKRALIEKDIIATTTRDCTNDHWSETKRLCIADSDNYDGSRACTDEVGATPAELVGLPKELGCKVLAAHAYDIANAPDGKFGIVRRKLAAQPEKKAQLEQLEQLIVRAREQYAKDCDEVPWTVEKRKCMAAATTQPALASCH